MRNHPSRFVLFFHCKGAFLWKTHPSPSAAAAWNQNRLPLPSPLFTPKRNPCPCKMALVMDSPSPVPARPASLRLRYYRSKLWRSSSGRMLRMGAQSADG